MARPSSLKKSLCGLMIVSLSSMAHLGNSAMAEEVSPEVKIQNAGMTAGLAGMTGAIGSGLGMIHNEVMITPAENTASPGFLKEVERANAHKPHLAATLKRAEAAQVSAMEDVARSKLRGRILESTFRVSIPVFFVGMATSLGGSYLRERSWAESEKMYKKQAESSAALTKSSSSAASSSAAN